MIHITEKQREFAESGISGIRQCTLWEANGEGAYYSEFEAGARFPLHDHEGIEQLLVLSGRIRFNEVEMRTGDFMKVAAGDAHVVCALERTVLFVAHRGGVVIKD